MRMKWSELLFAHETHASHSWVEVMRMNEQARLGGIRRRLGGLSLEGSHDYSCWSTMDILV